MRRMLALTTFVLFTAPLVACGGEALTAPDATASASSSSSSATTQTLSTTRDVERTDLVACPNRGTVTERVKFSGTLHLVVHVTENENNTRVKVQENFNIEGTGLQTGNTWRLIEAENTTHNFGSGLPVTFTNSGTLLAVSQGSQPNVVAKIVRKVTITASGVTADVAKFDVNCRG